jgi:FKBP-type peptidyl-prolyl cis-trans isomerase 2
MKTAKPGDVVKIIYSGQTQDGDFFETSADTPLEFTLGNSEVIAGLEKNVIGMRVGDKKTLTIPPEDGFGERQTKLVETVNRAQFPDHIKPKAGQRIKLRNGDGEETDIQVTKIEDDLVTLDANHPFSGKTLLFEIELLDIG